MNTNTFSNAMLPGANPGHPCLGKRGIDLCHLAALLLLGAGFAQASPIISDSFNYADSASLQAVWGTSANLVSGLTFGNLTTSGGALQFASVSGGDTYVGATLPSGIANGLSMWRSFLFRQDTALVDHSYGGEGNLLQNFIWNPSGGAWSYNASPIVEPSWNGMVGAYTAFNGGYNSGAAFYPAVGQTYLAISQVDKVGMGAYSGNQYITLWVFDQTGFNNLQTAKGSDPSAWATSDLTTYAIATSQTGTSTWGDPAVTAGLSDDFRVKWGTATIDEVNLGNTLPSVISLGAVTTNATTTAIASTLNPSTYGQPATFTATITPLAGAAVPTGTVQFKTNGAAWGSPVTVTTGISPNGTAALSTTNFLVSGSPYTVSAEFTAIGPFLNSTSAVPVVQTISKATPVVTAAGGTFIYTNTLIAGSGTATGGRGENLPVTLTYNGVGGTAYGPSSTPPSAIGTYSVTASTVGDANNNSGSSPAANLTIINVPTGTTTAVASSVNPSVYGAVAAFTATITPATGTAVPAGTVQFKTNNVNYLSPVTVTAGISPNGVAALSTTNLLVTGSPYTVTAEFTGAIGFLNSTDAVGVVQTISKATPTVTATGGTFNYTGSSIAASGAATGGRGESLPVTFSYSGAGYGPTSVGPTNRGTYTVTASTPGDANNNAAGPSAGATLTIITPPTTATVTADTADAIAYNWQDSIWRVGNQGDGDIWAGMQYWAGAPYVTGGACCAVFPFQLPAVPPGQAIQSATLQLYHSGNRTWGQGLTFNIDLYGLLFQTAPTVLAGWTPGGHFYYGPSDPNATKIVDNWLTPGSPATATVTADVTAYVNAQIAAGAVVGNYVFLRVSGDFASPVWTESSYQFASADNATPANRPVITFNIMAGTNTTTTLATSLNPSAYGQSVTFTATIAPATGSTVPTGTVQFKVDGVALGSPVTVTPGSGLNGTASLTTSSIGVAGSPHTVTAVFAATGDFFNSTGTLPGGQTVTAGPAYQIALVSGASQSAGLWTALPAPLVVQVSDINGQPVAGSNVTFALASVPAGATGQSLSITNAITDASGQASTSLTLGSKIGNYVVTASANVVLGSPVNFTATAFSSTVSLSFNVNYWVTTANPELYSINVPGAMDPSTATSQYYQQNLANMAPGIVRYQNGSQMTSGDPKCWVDYFTQTWNSGVISNALILSYTPKARLITITTWPTWMRDSTTGLLKTNKYDQYASFCSNLVGIVNQQLGYNVKYWEILNEQEGGYAGAGATLGAIFTNCAAKMKRQDPTIQIVGPAWTQPYVTDIGSFLDVAGSSLDVSSHHQYGGGGEITTPQQAYAAAPNVANGASFMRSTLNGKGLSAKKVWVDEYNIFYSYTFDSSTGYYYMKSAPGMIFDALVIKQIAEEGKATGLFLWNDSDNTYGCIPNGSYLAPCGNLLMLYNKWGVGNILRTISGDSSLVQGYAVLDSGSPSTGHIMLSVINRSTTNQVVILDSLGYTPAITTVEQDVISNSGLTRSIINWSELVGTSGITIAPNSVVVFRINELTQKPFPAVIPTLPATLQAEDFDNGGEGIAYHSATAFNSGWVYRTDVGVNIFPIPPTTNTFTVALAAGDWTEHTVNVPAGTYQINARVAGSGAFRVSLNGTTLTNFSPSTGGTNTFATLSSANVVLSAGSGSVVRIDSTVGGFNLDSIQFVAVTSPPVITGLAPATGLAVGGTAVTVTGSNFLPGATVQFGAHSPQAGTLTGSTNITVLTPANPPGLVNVIVSNTSGLSATNQFTYVLASPVVNATGGTFAYDGNPKAGSGTATGATNESLAVTLSYAGSAPTSYGPTASAPSAAGTYTVTASTAGDAVTASGSSSAAALTINQATPVVTATGGAFTYDGTPKAGGGSATGGNGGSLPVTLSYHGTGTTTYGPTASAPSAAGTYTVTASTAGDANNTPGTSSAVALTIVQPPPLVITGSAMMPGVGFVLTFSGPSNQTYEVLSSTDMTIPMANWNTNATGAFNGSPVTFTNPAPTDAQNFYRLKSP